MTRKAKINYLRSVLITAKEMAKNYKRLIYSLEQKIAELEKKGGSNGEV